MRVHDNRAIRRNVETEKRCNSPAYVQKQGMAEEQTGEEDRPGMADRCREVPEMVVGRVMK